MANDEAPLSEYAAWCMDKFAAMPWTGEVGGFFGRVQRHDQQGFYGPCAIGIGRPLPQDRLPPPDLIIQDELHLISGPLGTIVGLYESALEELCSVKLGDKVIRPKIVASTATVRRADAQIRALFARSHVDVFPPPGPVTNRQPGRKFMISVVSPWIWLARV